MARARNLADKLGNSTIPVPSGCFVSLQPITHLSFQILRPPKRHNDYDLNILKIYVMHLELGKYAIVHTFVNLSVASKHKTLEID